MAAHLHPKDIDVFLVFKPSGLPGIDSRFGSSHDRPAVVVWNAPVLAFGK
jgi:hypothetical protein